MSSRGISVGLSGSSLHPWGGSDDDEKVGLDGKFQIHARVGTVDKSGQPQQHQLVVISMFLSLGNRDKVCFPGSRTFSSLKSRWRGCATYYCLAIWTGSEAGGVNPEAEFGCHSGCFIADTERIRMNDFCSFAASLLCKAWIPGTCSDRKQV